MTFPPPGDLPDSGIESASLGLLHWQTDSLPQSQQSRLLVILQARVRVILFALLIDLNFFLEDGVERFEFNGPVLFYGN